MYILTVSVLLYYGKINEIYEIFLLYINLRVIINPYLCRMYRILEIFGIYTNYYYKA